MVRLSDASSVVSSDVSRLGNDWSICLGGVHFSPPPRSRILVIVFEFECSIKSLTPSLRTIGCPQPRRVEASSSSGVTGASTLLQKFKIHPL